MIPPKLKSIFEILAEKIKMVEDIFQILSPVLFSICINLDLGLKEFKVKFADNTKLGGAAEGRGALQRDLEKSEKWAITNSREINKDKGCVLQLGWAALDVQAEWGMRGWEAAVGQDLGVLVDGKLNTSQQCPGSQEPSLGHPNPVLEHQHSITSQARERIVLLCSALEQPHLQRWGQFWVPQ
ncbi:hypothetical protein TURU_068342 [Turdus rufiventris]|nr:hypothetical protein TURU_068342 [Turdus rufiventris]